MLRIIANSLITHTFFAMWDFVLCFSVLVTWQHEEHPMCTLKMNRRLSLKARATRRNLIH